MNQYEGETVTSEPAQVFLSVGRIFAPEHRRLLSHLHDATATNGLALKRLGAAAECPSENPLDAVGALLQRSYGALIVAYPRLRYEGGVEYPDSPDETPLPARHLTTVWNQIETALALHYRLPILTLVESHVHAEGLLSPRRPQYHAVCFDLDACQDAVPPVILAELRTFADRVRAFQAAQSAARIE